MNIDEQKILSLMLNIYCKKNHKHRIKEDCDNLNRLHKGLCDDCHELLLYAIQRHEKCPRKDVKTFCNTCPIHCYTPQKREEIKKVMKFSGKWMIFYHPLISISHIVNTLKEKRGKND